VIPARLALSTLVFSGSTSPSATADNGKPVKTFKQAVLSS
jgi:hypothetical protein